MEDSGTILLEKKDGLAVITLAHPKKLNALSTVLRKKLGEHLAAIGDDNEVKVVLLRGEGRAFCAGADLQDAPTTPLEWRDRVLLAQKHHIAIARMRKPVIAAVQGPAVGGGASLALAADILIMADNAKLVFPFVRLGVVPDGGMAYLLQAKLHAAAALELLLSGGTMKADEAQRLGLTRHVVSANKLDSYSEAYARDLCGLPWEAVMLTKALCTDQWATGLERTLAHEADAFALASSTDGHKSAMQEVQKRGQKGNP